MNKKVTIIVIIIVLIVFSLVIFSTSDDRNRSIKKENRMTDDFKNSISFDEGTGEFVVFDEETGDEIARGEDEVSLYIYKIDPTYNP